MIHSTKHLNIFIFVLLVGIFLSPHSLALHKKTETGLKINKTQNTCPTTPGKYFYGFPISKNVTIPVYSNRENVSGCPDKKIERAIIVIHGVNRTASNYFNYISKFLPFPQENSAQTTKTDNNSNSSISVGSNESNNNYYIPDNDTIIISHAEQDSTQQNIITKNRNPSQNEKQEEPSEPNQENTLVIAPLFSIRNSSICDSVVCRGNDDYDPHFLYWPDHDWSALSTSGKIRGFQTSSGNIIDSLLDTLINKNLYPNLKKITIAGHSAGGQFVNRYSNANPKEQDVVNEGVGIRYIVANPSSYIYLNEYRYNSDIEDFVIPDTCSHYNKYRFGLENPVPYFKNNLNSIFENASIRDIHILIGEDDNFNEGHLDTDCEAMLQGAQRLERAENYFEFLNWLFPQGHNTQLTHIPYVGHSAQQMFGSPIGRNTIYW